MNGDFGVCHFCNLRMDRSTIGKAHSTPKPPSLSCTRRVTDFIASVGGWRDRSDMQANAHAVVPPRSEGEQTTLGRQTLAELAAINDPDCPLVSLDLGLAWKDVWGQRMLMSDHERKAVVEYSEAERQRAWPVPHYSSFVNAGSVHPGLVAVEAQWGSIRPEDRGMLPGRNSLRTKATRR